jgi:DNA mismatch endonuclease (patch repair protein)
MDNVDTKTRSKMMSNIKSKNTKPEVIIRKKLFARGYRYSLHSKKLGGKPDIVLKKYNAVIFIHGCFWHMHDCSLFVLPKTRTEFWKSKFTGNKIRDEKNISTLRENGWRVGIVWECSVKGKKELELNQIVDLIDEWLKSNVEIFEIPMRG